VAFCICILSVSPETTGNPQEKQQYPETSSQSAGKFDGKIEHLFTLITADRSKNSKIRRFSLAVSYFLLSGDFVTSQV
jgi:hypothetical protein